MHRRARHLNPASAGAVLAFDSRFITGLSDGDPVSTWSDRSGNARDATGSGTSRPTYETNEQGGQPGVRFDGSNDVLSSSQALPTGTGGITSIIGFKITSLTTPQFSTVFSQGTNTGTGTRFIMGRGPYGGPNRHYIDGNNTGYFAANDSATLNPTIMLGGKPTNGINSDCVLVLNGTTVSGTASGGTGVWSIASTNTFIGALNGAGSESWAGNVFFVQAFSVLLSTPLQRRFQHAAAFSFKIPCS